MVDFLEKRQIQLSAEELAKKQFDLFSLAFGNLRQALEVTLTSQEADKLIAIMVATLVKNSPRPLFLTEG